MEAGDVFAFFDETRLTGVGGAWELQQLSGPLALEVTAGALDGAGVTVGLAAPFVGEIDLSGVLVGEELPVSYLMIADAVDTVQADSRISVHARDPLDPASGVFFEFSGLTPLPVPEPAPPILLAAGLAVLLALARRRGAAW